MKTMLLQLKKNILHKNEKNNGTKIFFKDVKTELLDET